MPTNGTNMTPKTSKPKARNRPDTSFNFGANTKPSDRSRSSAYFQSKHVGVVREPLRAVS